MNHELNACEVIQQFAVLHAPLTADIKTLRHARNEKLHALYEKSLIVSQLEESLALDKEITSIQQAYFFIKRHYHNIQAQLDQLMLNTR